MDLRKLKTMIDLVSESNISELEVAEGDSKIRISKASSISTQPLTNTTPGNIHYIASQSVTHSNEAVDIQAPYSENISSSEPFHQVKCPMVGTFYTAPSPGSEPFVKIGNHVTIGQTMGIVEAMKLLNEIECDKNGIVKEILVSDGQPVQYGQALFIIE